MTRDDRSGTPDRVGTRRALGVVAGAAGLAASAFVLFGPVVRYTSVRSDGTVTTGTRSGIDWLLGVPDAQFALFAWPVALGLVAAIGAVTAWRGRQRWTAGVALALATFTVIGMMSIGLLYAPAAALMLFAAALGDGA